MADFVRGQYENSRGSDASCSDALLFFKEPASCIDTDRVRRGLFELLVLTYRLIRVSYYAMILVDLHVVYIRKLFHVLLCFLNQ